MAGFARLVLGIVLGTVVGGFIVFLIEGVSHMIWPPPPRGLDRSGIFENGLQNRIVRGKARRAFGMGHGCFLRRHCCQAR